MSAQGCGRCSRSRKPVEHPDDPIRYRFPPAQPAERHQHQRNSKQPHHPFQIRPHQLSTDYSVIRPIVSLELASLLWDGRQHPVHQSNVVIDISAPVPRHLRHE